MDQNQLKVVAAAYSARAGRRESSVMCESTFEQLAIGASSASAAGNRDVPSNSSGNNDNNSNSATSRSASKSPAGEQLDWPARPAYALPPVQYDANNNQLAPARLHGAANLWPGQLDEQPSGQQQQQYFGPDRQRAAQLDQPAGELDQAGQFAAGDFFPDGLMAEPAPFGCCGPAPGEHASGACRLYQRPAGGHLIEYRPLEEAGGQQVAYEQQQQQQCFDCAYNQPAGYESQPAYQYQAGEPDALLYQVGHELEQEKTYHLLGATAGPGQFDKHYHQPAGHYQPVDYCWPGAYADQLDYYEQQLVAAPQQQHQSQQPPQQAQQQAQQQQQLQQQVLVSDLYNPAEELFGSLADSGQAALSACGHSRARWSDDETLDRDEDEDEDEDDEDEDNFEPSDEAGPAQVTVHHQSSSSCPSISVSLAAGQAARAAGGGLERARGCQPETAQRLRAFLLERINRKRAALAGPSSGGYRQPSSVYERDHQASVFVQLAAPKPQQQQQQQQQVAGESALKVACQQVDERESGQPTPEDTGEPSNQRNLRSRTIFYVGSSASGSASTATSGSSSTAAWQSDESSESEANQERAAASGVLTRSESKRRRLGAGSNLVGQPRQQATRRRSDGSLADDQPLSGGSSRCSSSSPSSLRFASPTARRRASCRLAKSDSAASKPVECNN